MFACQEYASDDTYRPYVNLFIVFLLVNQLRSHKSSISFNLVSNVFITDLMHGTIAGYSTIYWRQFKRIMPVYEYTLESYIPMHDAELVELINAF